jgi:hypothetical protein
MFATAAYGYAYGDPMKVITPFDYDGKNLLAHTQKEIFDANSLWFEPVLNGLK